MKVIGQSRSFAAVAKAAAGVLGPLVTAALAVFMSVRIVYSGGLRDSLNSKAENLLIEASVRMRPAVPKAESDITVISLQDGDLDTVPLAPSLLRDATIETYARVLKVVAASNPRFVVMTWLTNAHPLEALSAEQLVPILESFNLRPRFLLSLPFVNDSRIPEDLGKSLPLADGDDCIYDINRLCSYPDSWDEWIIKKLAQEFWSPVPKWHISSNLPYLNSYILNFPDPEAVDHLSFKQVLSGQPLPEHRIYFIGNDVTQDLRFRNAKYVLQRTFTFDAKDDRDLQLDGIPFHEFWARLTQMFEAKTTVAVVPGAIERTLAAVYMLGLLLIMLRFGVVWAFAVLLVNILSLPVANAFMLSYAKVYLPAFNLIFGGIIVCIVGMMISVSWSAYQRFRSAAATQHYRDVADIKSNFVSLVSHNLNTTVGKLANLSDIFKNSPLFAAQAAIVQATDRSIGELFLCVRNVLTNLSMHDRHHGASVQPLTRVVADFNTSYASMLRRLAIDYEVEVEAGALGSAVFTGNVRILHQCLASLLSLTEAFAAEGCLLSLSMDPASGRLNITGKYFLVPHPATAVRAFQTSEGAAALDGFARLMLEFVLEVVAWASGALTAEQRGEAVVVTAHLDFASTTK